MDKEIIFTSSTVHGKFYLEKATGESFQEQILEGKEVFKPSPKISKFKRQ